MELDRNIEAILFYMAEPVAISRLSKLVKRTEGDTRDALNTLESRFSGGGIRLIRNGDEVTLGTAPEAGAMIEAIAKEELSRELSKASLETLAIVLYKGAVTRSDIDHIRGVNSTFILRNLQVRGLVERVENPDDQRSFLYKPTFQLLEHMGVTKIEELPEYASAMAAIAGFIAQSEEEANKVSVEDGETAVVEAPTADASMEIEADISEEDQSGAGYSDSVSNVDQQIHESEK